MFTLRTRFTTFAQGGGGGVGRVKSVVDMTVNSKKENS